MNVLLLTDDMKPSGVARHVTDLANGLAERGAGVTVAASNGPFRSRLDGLANFVPLGMVDGVTGKKRMGAVVRETAKLVRLATERRVDIVHTHKRFPDIVGRLVSRLTGIPHLSTCHNTFTDLKRFSIFGDRTLACCDAVHKMLLREFRKKSEAVQTAYNGIKPLKVYSGMQLAAVRRDLGLPDDTRVIASVGHMTRQKDPHTLIESVALLSSRGCVENSAFLLVGEGPEESSVRRKIAAGALEPYVRLLPATTDVEAVMNISEFLVLSSYREGLPYVLLEGASLGKPHVATDVGGVSEFIVHGKTGWLVPPHNAERLADSILLFLNDFPFVQRLGANAREKAHAQFSYDAFVDAVLKVYESMLS